MSEELTITDEMAVEAFKKREVQHALPASIGVPRTVWYSIASKDTSGKSIFIDRIFLKAGMWCNPIEWELAKEYEKKFPKLNKAHRDALDAYNADRIKLGRPHEVEPWKVNVSANPLKATVLEIGR